MLATLGELTEFRVPFNGNRGSVTLIYGDRRKMRKMLCATGRLRKGGGGAKPAAQLSAVVPSFVAPPAQPGESGAVRGGGGGETDG